MNVLISTDSTADLTDDLIEKYNIHTLPMRYSLDDVMFDGTNDIPKKTFYQKMRTGSIVSTSQTNEYDAKVYFKKLLESKKDIVHIAFSSELSGSTFNLIRVANELNENSENKIYIIDSLCGGSSQAILTLLACEMVEDNQSIGRIVEAIREKVPNVCSYFTVDNLKYLHKGGRISKLTALVGSILNIKPIIYADSQGKLATFKKVMTRKKSLIELSRIVAKKITDKRYIFISHADAESDANFLAELMEESIGIKPIITELTQILGCHAGPGLVAIFFMSNSR